MPVGREVPTLIAPKAQSRGERGGEETEASALVGVLAGRGVLVVAGGGAEPAGSGGCGGPSQIPQGPPQGRPQERASREEGSPPTALSPWERGGQLTSPRLSVGRLGSRCPGRASGQDEEATE